MFKPTFTWDEELGVSSCTLKYKNKKFTGYAFCSPDDDDMKSEKTGCQIALLRAEIEYYNYIINVEISPLLRSYNSLYTNMTYSKKFDKEHYEAKCIRKEIYNLKEDLKTAKQLLKYKTEELDEFIQVKEEMYQKIRKMRSAT